MTIWLIHTNTSGENKMNGLIPTDIGKLTLLENLDLREYFLLIL